MIFTIPSNPNHSVSLPMTFPTNKLPDRTLIPEKLNPFWCFFPCQWCLDFCTRLQPTVAIRILHPLSSILLIRLLSRLIWQGFTLWSKWQLLWLTCPLYPKAGYAAIKDLDLDSGGLVLVHLSLIYLLAVFAQGIYFLWTVSPLVQHGKSHCPPTGKNF